MPSGIKALTENPTAFIIGQKIGEDLFGADMSKARKADTEKIIMHLAESVLTQLNPEMIKETVEEISEIKGPHTKNISSKLNKFVNSYKANAMQATWMGAFGSGGIQLDEAKLNKNGAAILTTIQNSNQEITK
jgi:hypothetical protein